MGTDGIFAEFSPATGGDQQLLDRARNLTARKLADRIVATDLAAGYDCAALSRSGARRMCHRPGTHAVVAN